MRGDVEGPRCPPPKPRPGARKCRGSRGTTNSERGISRVLRRAAQRKKDALSVKGMCVAPDSLVHFTGESAGDVQPWSVTCRHDRWPCVIVVGMLLLSWVPGWVYTAELGNTAQGQRLYRYYCAACHGIDGTGTGRNAPYLEHMGRAPRDHTDIWYMNRLSDPELYRAISEGKRRDGEPPFMPWWGYTLTPEQIWSLVAFIRSLGRDTTD